MDITQSVSSNTRPTYRHKESRRAAPKGTSLKEDSLRKGGRVATLDKDTSRIKADQAKL